MSDLIGKTVGQYQVIEQIGRGGMATIFKAYQPSIDRYVAIKTLPREMAKDPTFIKRFIQEAKAIAALEHPHILPVHDFGTEDKLNYMVMRYVKGGTLADLMGTKIPLAKTAKYVGNVARALDYAHRRGIIHRDIKPSNILIDENGEVLLTDFGIAKIVEGTETSQLTATGSVLGTPAYMSPEQTQSTQIDHRSDIYSLGVVLYELLTGQPPYQAETPFAVALKHVNDPLPPPRQIDPDIPEVFERIVFKAMAKSPEDRFQSAGDLAQALQAALTEGASTALSQPALSPPPPSPSPADDGGTVAVPASPTTAAAPSPEPGRSRSMTAPLLVGGGLIIVLLCLLVGGVGYLIAGSSDDAEPEQRQASSNVDLGAPTGDAGDDNGADDGQPASNGDSEAPAAAEEQNPPPPPPTSSSPQQPPAPQQQRPPDGPPSQPPPGGPPAPGSILFEDDFSTNRHDWPDGVERDDFGEVETAFEDGEYVVRVATNEDMENFFWGEPLPVRLRDFSLSVDAEVLEDSDDYLYGIAFRRTSRDDAYVWELYADGFDFYRVLRDEIWEELVGYTETRTLVPGEVNRFEITAIGPTITLAINGETVITIEDDLLKEGSIALFVDNYEPDSEVIVAFDNLVIRAP